MRLTPAGWHQRFIRQAAWTRDLRRNLFVRAGISRASAILEVGCGTGALLPDLLESSPAAVYGLDIQLPYLQIASVNAPGSHLTLGDALQLPYARARFDLVLCHFFFLWVSDPERSMAEMVRVTRPGGAILALAEPDYGGRIDYPSNLAVLGKWQQTALASQGANPEMGRRLSGIFARAGLKNIESGVLGGQWSGQLPQDEWESEWAVLRADLEQLANAYNLENLERLREIDAKAWENGERVLFVPTFYAWGWVPY